MTSLSDLPCLIEHELYVENAVLIIHTLSTRECSSNERLRPRGGGVGQVRIQRGGTGGPDPPGKSQVIWVSIGNK